MSVRIWRRNGVWVRTIRRSDGAKVHHVFRDFPEAVAWMLAGAHVTPETAAEWLETEANRQPPRERGVAF